MHSHATNTQQTIQYNATLQNTRLATGSTNRNTSDQNLPRGKAVVIPDISQCLVASIHSTGMLSSHAPATLG